MAQWERVVGELVATRRAALVGYACLFAVDWADAEDLVQEALVRTFAKRRALADVRAAEAYVRRAVRTVFLDMVRRRKAWTRREHLLVSAPPRSADDVAVAGVDVQAALVMLGPRERACVVLRFFDDMAVAEIAAELGVSEGAVKRYLSDGTAKLRGLLAESVTWGDDELFEARVAVTPVRGGSGS